MSFDPQASAEYWARENQKELAALHFRIEQAKLEAARLAEALKAQGKATKVVLFGSIAEGSVRSTGFDLDLAIVGGDERVCRELVEASVFPVDLVDYDLLPAHIRQRIDRFGIVL